jgi:hypothetical protein
MCDGPLRALSIASELCYNALYAKISTFSYTTDARQYA